MSRLKYNLLHDVARLASLNEPSMYEPRTSRLKPKQIRLDEVNKDDKTPINLIRNLYEKEFYPEGFSETKYADSRIYAIRLPLEYSEATRFSRGIAVYTIGYLFVNKVDSDDCAYICTYALKEYCVGHGILKFILPSVKKLISGLAGTVIYSFTDNEKVGNSLKSNGYIDIGNMYALPLVNK